MKLRPYQQEAVNAVYEHLRTRTDNPCVVLPTASGKTPVMATICRDAVTKWKGRVLIVAHVKELLEQSVDKLHQVAPELFMKTGVYSAGLNSRDTDQPIIVAGIQSVYKKACDLGAFDLIIIDEAHMIPESGDGMYRQFLKDAKVVNPNLRVIGLTATPFRLKSGSICDPDNFLNTICYEIGVKELIVAGYLSPLVTKSGKEKANTDDLHMRGGEFIASETQDLMDTDELVESACEEIVEYTKDRKSVLIFASGIQHAKHIYEVLLEKHGIEAGMVFGDSSDRDETLEDFKAGRLKYLINVKVLTTGFDCPRVDCVCLLMATASAGLYYQIVGRGFRLFDGKENCLVLDFGNNVMRHGPVDQIRIKDKIKSSRTGEAPAKECPECHAIIAAGYTVCPDCNYEFPLPEAKHEATATSQGIISGQYSIDESYVQNVNYSVHTKAGADDSAPKTMRVEYTVGWNQYVSEWICLEHTGWARAKAESWWNKRCTLPPPTSAAEAVQLADEGWLCNTTKITVKTTVGDYDRIIGYELGEKPEWPEAPKQNSADQIDDIPF